MVWGLAVVSIKINNAVKLDFIRRTHARTVGLVCYVGSF